MSSKEISTTNPTTTQDNTNSKDNTNSNETPTIKPATTQEIMKLKNRWSGVEFIQEAGDLLQLEQSTIACAAVYFHSFYDHFQFQDYDKHLIGSACILLASKSEENYRRFRDIINVMQKIIFPLKEPLSIMSKEYRRYKEKIGEHEQKLLRALMFDTTVDHPYKYLMNYCFYFSQKNPQMRMIQQLAWTILNDSLRLPIMSKYKGHELAVSAIYLASQFLEAPIAGLARKHNYVWYRECEVTEATMEKIIPEILRMYILPLIPPTQKPAMPVAPIGGPPLPNQMQPPPPNFNAPHPNFNAPPPNFNAPPQNHMQPPPNFNAPPPNNQSWNDRRR